MSTDLVALCESILMAPYAHAVKRVECWLCRGEGVAGEIDAHEPGLGPCICPNCAGSGKIAVEEKSS